MSSFTQFRHYLISQDAGGANIEIARTDEQVGVLAFDSQRLQFVHCHVLLAPLTQRRAFDDRTRLLSDTGHPLLARVLESGEDDGSAYYITENVDGETLTSLLSRHETLPVWLAVQLTALALDALLALAARGNYVAAQPLDMLRVVQTSARSLVVVVSDYQLGESPVAKAARSRLLRSGFDKQAQYVAAYFNEHAQAGGAERGLSTADFIELTGELMLACGPDTRGAMDALRKSLRAAGPQQPAAEIAPNLKPRPLLAPLLASFQDVARSVVRVVRMQSQKLDAAQPYALRGTLLKSGQNVNVEQVPPQRLSGSSPRETLRQARSLPRLGKFPNLMPLVFVEAHDEIECAAETAVEGVALSALMAVRGALDAQETYLVLAGVDAALGQLEKSERNIRRLRLEDIFLFTGLTGETPAGFLLPETKLNEWPGFSIVLRGHPCLHAMVGRGTDPAMLLPLEPKMTGGDAEPVWNGGWMAALGACLTGANEGAGPAPFSAGLEPVQRLLNDELGNARKGSPGSRSSFLARFVRVMREYDLAHVKTGGLWQEVGGTSGVQGRAVEAARPTAAKLPPRHAGIGMPALLLPAAGEEPHIGFAEALIHSPEEEEEPRSLPSMMPSVQTPQETGESSWTGFRQERPLWIRVTLLALASIVLGAVLAILQGRAFWQPAPPKVRGAEAIEGPVAVTPSAAVFSNPSNGTEGSAPILPLPDKSSPAETNLDPVPRKGSPMPGPTKDGVDEALQQAWRAGARLTDPQRAVTEKAAQRGVSAAMIALGNSLLRGDAGKADERAAFSWFGKAHAAGDSAAMVPLASCYLQGWGTAPDFARAVTLLTKAATEGNATAKDLLGVCFSRGLGVERDEAKALKLFTEAHDAGVAAACASLGLVYRDGHGVTPDPARAMQFFAEGAEKGHAESMLLYAQGIESGLGAIASSTRAAAWYQKAARAGNAEAANWCRRRGLSF